MISEILSFPDLIGESRALDEKLDSRFRGNDKTADVYYEAFNN